MRGHIVLLFLGCIWVYGTEATRTYTVYNVTDAPKLYVKYLRDHNKYYDTLKEVLIHYDAFKDALIRINILNKKSKTAVYGLTKFADYTQEEYKWTRW